MYTDTYIHIYTAYHDPTATKMVFQIQHSHTHTHTVEVAFYAVNCMLVIDIFKASDVGGSMTIHMFGAYFSMAMAAVMRCVLFNHRYTYI